MCSLESLSGSELVFQSVLVSVLVSQLEMVSE